MTKTTDLPDAPTPQAQARWSPIEKEAMAIRAALWNAGSLAPKQDALVAALLATRPAEAASGAAVQPVAVRYEAKLPEGSPWWEISVEQFERIKDDPRYTIRSLGVIEAASGPSDADKRDADKRDAERSLRALRNEALEIFDGPETPQDVRDVIEWYTSSIGVILGRARAAIDAALAAAQGARDE